MKRFLLIVISILIAAVCFGQEGCPIKFLGLPIDGSETEFTKQLKRKGFTYNDANECFKGQFNGRSVDVFVHTNHGTVDRVYVAFPSTNEATIKGEYNNLLKQFRDNAKYVDLSMNEEISDTEDISYEMSVKSKRYQASFSYFDADRDPVAMMNALLDKFTDFYTPEQLEKLKEYVKKAADAPDDQKSAIKDQMTAEMQKMAFSDNPDAEVNEEKAWKFLATFMDGLRSLEDGSVWFMIHEHYGRYYIGLYYDNTHNQAHGEDL